MGRLWIVTPVYYDFASFSKLREEVSQAHDVYRFVVIDDSAGRDADIDQLKSMDDVYVIEPPFNLGHQRGIVFGLRQITHLVGEEDTVVTMDSDGEDRPQDIGDMINQLVQSKDSKNSLVLVERSKRKEGLVFRFFYFFYKRVFRWLTGTVIRSGNFAAYRGSFLKSYIRHPYFDLCYSSTLVCLKVERLTIEKPRGVRFSGESKMNFTSLIMHGIRMLMPFIDQIAIRSLMAFAIMFTVSVLSGLAVVAIKLFTESAIPGWASSIVSLFALMSIVNLGNFLVLFSVYSQSQALAMQRMESKSSRRLNSEKTGSQQHAS